MTATIKDTPGTFSPYQKIVVTILAFLQFAVIVDFMLMSPLGAMIIPELKIDTAQFGLVVSAYAFSAGIAGLLTAGLADRYDRKKLLLFFYTGFLLGTLWCGLASSYEMLLLARIVTGLFGGVMGLIQTAFAASQVLGIPIGLYLANRWDWHMPFLAMAGFGLVGGLLMLRKMQPVNAHLALPQEHSPWMHLYHTVTERRYLLAFAITAVLTTGGFMLMPFSSAYIVNNLGIDMHQLPTVYLVTGVCTIFFGPLIGKAADAYGKFRVFSFGTVVSIVMVLIYTRLTAISLPALIIINALMFVGIFSRMIPYQALVSSVPAANQRGSFNAISASIQQLAGGVASVIAGHIVTFGADGKLQHFDLIGDVMVGTALLALGLLWLLQRGIAKVAVVK